MKTAQFTPGPWIAERDTARNAYAWKVTGASGIVRDIARLALVDSMSQVEANAALIAAAPAMYEALRVLTSEINLSTLNVRKDFSLMNAHACAVKAILQAEGRRRT